MLLPKKGGYMKFPSIKNILVIGGIVLLLVAVFQYIKPKGKLNNGVNPENTLVQETEMNEPAKEDKGLSLIEQQQLKNTIDTTLEDKDTKTIILKDVSGGNSYGSASRLYKNSLFSFKAVLKDLPSPEKGFYFEGWLVDPSAKYFSLGRVNPEKTQGTLYYQSSTDETAYNQVVVTLEPEDDNPAPGKHIQEGKF